jgi:hypothetical protein
MEVMKKWMAQRITELLGMEDDVTVDFAFELVNDKSGASFNPNIKLLQIKMQGFLGEEPSAKFSSELWDLMLSAQESSLGVPSQLLEAKKAELLQERASHCSLSISSMDANNIFHRKRQRNGHKKSDDVKSAMQHATETWRIGVVATAGIAMTDAIEITVVTGAVDDVHLHLVQDHPHVEEITMMIRRTIHTGADTARAQERPHGAGATNLLLLTDGGAAVHLRDDVEEAHRCQIARLRLRQDDVVLRRSVHLSLQLVDEAQLHLHHETGAIHRHHRMAIEQYLTL